jgi:hypothetical protein
MRAAIGELLAVMRRGDLAGFQRLCNRLGIGDRRMSPDELKAAVGELALVAAYRAQRVFARLALVAGACVEWGGSPFGLAGVAPACTLVTMRLRARFSELWPVAGAGVRAVARTTRPRWAN